MLPKCTSISQEVHATEHLVEASFSSEINGIMALKYRLGYKISILLIFDTNWEPNFSMTDVQSSRFS